MQPFYNAPSDKLHVKSCDQESKITPNQDYWLVPFGFPTKEFYSKEKKSSKIRLFSQKMIIEGS